jgi:hypothetical protein
MLQHDTGHNIKRRGNATRFQNPAEADILICGELLAEQVEEEKQTLQQQRRICIFKHPNHCFSFEKRI